MKDKKKVKGVVASFVEGAKKNPKLPAPKPKKEKYQTYQRSSIALLLFLIMMTKLIWHYAFHNHDGLDYRHVLVYRVNLLIQSPKT